MQKEMTIQVPFYRKLKHDKIEINWNKNPIKMNLFLSFLQVEVIRSTNHLGSDTGWTQLRNDERQLIVGGGIVNGVEFLDRLQYGRNLSNPYNNYVNPFYLFDILSKEGQRFFLDYYKSDIDKLVSDQKSSIKYLEARALHEKEELERLLLEIETINTNTISNGRE